MQKDSKTPFFFLFFPSKDSYSHSLSHSWVFFCSFSFRFTGAFIACLWMVGHKGREGGREGGKDKDAALTSTVPIHIDEPLLLLLLFGSFTSFCDYEHSHSPLPISLLPLLTHYFSIPSFPSSSSSSLYCRHSCLSVTATAAATATTAAATATAAAATTTAAAAAATELLLLLSLFSLSLLPSFFYKMWLSLLSLSTSLLSPRLTFSPTIK